MKNKGKERFFGWSIIAIASLALIRITNTVGVNSVGGFMDFVNTQPMLLKQVAFWFVPIIFGVLILSVNNEK